MEMYKTKVKLLPGTNLAEVAKQARKVLRAVEQRTKRQPYIRSAYFKKQKVFLNYLWPHMNQKVPPERMRRLRYVAAAVELVRYSRHQPTSQPNPNKPTERLHRFLGITQDGKRFAVQIKENLRTKRLYLISCFPWEK